MSLAFYSASSKRYSFMWNCSFFDSLGQAVFESLALDGHQSLLLGVLDVVRDAGFPFLETLKVSLDMFKFSVFSFELVEVEVGVEVVDVAA